MVRYLVTGAGGFAGRHLVEHLLQEGEAEVIGLHGRSAPPLPGERALVCDLRDADRVARLIERHRPDVIFHLAAQSYVPRALAAPADTLINNATSQINLLEGCRAAGIDPVVVVASSAEVYGAVPPERLPAGEDEPFRPSNPYAVSKVTQDMIALQYHLTYGMKTVRLRPFNHIGPGQSDRFVVASFARQIAEAEAGKGAPVLLVGNREAARDFLDVRDVVRAYRLVARDAFSGQVFNVASGIPRTIQSILDGLLALASVELEVRLDPARMRPSDVPVLIGSASRLRAATGWEPMVPLERSLSDTLDYWRERVRRHG